MFISFLLSQAFHHIRVLLDVFCAALVRGGRPIRNSCRPCPRWTGKRRWRLSVLVTKILVVLYLLRRICGLLRGCVAAVLPSSLVELVNLARPSSFSRPTSRFRSAWRLDRWYGPFYDLIQAALSKSAAVKLEQFENQLATFAGIAFIAVGVGVRTRFFLVITSFDGAGHEQLLHRELGSTPLDRRCFAARPRGHDAVRLDNGGARHQSHRRTHDLGCVSPVLVRLSINVTELPPSGASHNRLYSPSWGQLFLR